ncbi:MAG: hypothetical protein ACJA0H_000543 [Francisellaceae bacterium]|jgi:hypothetical protein
MNKRLIFTAVLSLGISLSYAAQQLNLKDMKPGDSQKVSDSAMNSKNTANNDDQKGQHNVYVNTGNQFQRQPCTITYNTMAQEIVNQSTNYVTIAVNANSPQSQKFSVQAKALSRLKKVFPDVVWQPISLTQNGKCSYGGSVCDYTFLVKARLNNEDMQKLTNQGQITPAGDSSVALNSFDMQFSIANANNETDPNYTAKITQDLQNKILANISKQIETVNKQLGATYELQKVNYYPIQYDKNKDRLSQQITLGAKYIIATNCKAGSVVR